MVNYTILFGMGLFKNSLVVQATSLFSFENLSIPRLLFCSSCQFHFYTSGMRLCLNGGLSVLLKQRVIMSSFARFPPLIGTICQWMVIYVFACNESHGA